MKIPFNIKFRPQIESGEYKVETRSGKTARIVCWDRVGTSLVVLVGKDEDVLTYNSEGTTGQEMQLPSDLFIVTPEEELTEWEKAIKDLVLAIDEGELRELGVFEEENLGAWAVKKAAELLSLAIDARARELSEGFEQSKIDKDSIPYHLIEFMCDLYDCRNWKEIEETAELYVTRIKAAAMKDLPRWGPSTGCFDEGWLNAGILYYKFHAIPLKTLETLPGFKED